MNGFKVKFHRRSNLKHACILCPERSCRFYGSRKTCSNCIQLLVSSHTQPQYYILIFGRNEVCTDVSIIYDPASSMYKIAPPEYMASNSVMIYCDTVIYQHGTIIPLRKWELMIPNSSDIASNFGKTALVEVGPGNKKISKPPNCFILFRRDHRHTVQKRYPNATIGEICE